MNYETAKKLMDMNFPGAPRIPSMGKRESYLCKNGEQCVWAGKGLNGKHKWMHICEGVGVPSLSELIGACGDGFKKLFIVRGYRYDLQNHPIMGSDPTWYAETGWESTRCEKCNGEVKKSLNGYGSTPEEAVANLWLELNKK